MNFSNSYIVTYISQQTFSGKKHDMQKTIIQKLLLSALFQLYGVKV